MQWVPHASGMPRMAFYCGALLVMHGHSSKYPSHVMPGQVAPSAHVHPLKQQPTITQDKARCMVTARYTWANLPRAWQKERQGMRTLSRQP